MINRDALRELLHKEQVVESLFDLIRLVDPVKKRIEASIEPKETKIMVSALENKCCFGIFDKSSPCDNCISMRSFNTSEVYSKIENRGTSTFYVTTKPTTVHGRKLVLEMIRDITKDSIMTAKNVQTHNVIATKDVHTKAYSGQYIYERLPYELFTARDNGENITLYLVKLMVDQEAFIPFVNEYMKQVFSIMKNSIRGEEDWIARKSTFEFLLVMHNLTDINAEKIRSRFDNKFQSLATKREERCNCKILIGLVNVGHLDAEPVLGTLLDSVTKDMERRINMKTEEDPVDKTELRCHLNFSLSQREREVAVHVIEGMTNEEMAKKLYIGLSTVKKHVSSILSKTGSRSRSEFVQRCLNNSA